MMNYSDYDSDDYSSNEDEDYVPSDDNLSEDDLNECEKEDGLDEENQNQALKEQTEKKKKAIKGLSARKRKKGVLKMDGGEESGTFKQKEEDPELPEEMPAGKSTNNKEDQQQQKADDLWASFLSDVGPRPKAEAPGTQQIPADLDNVDKSSTESPHKETKTAEASRITITKVYDFAGEEVQVTKEVDADSREAKSFLKKEQREEKQQSPICKTSTESSLTPGPSVSWTVARLLQLMKSSMLRACTALVFALEDAKRGAGMSSILSRIGAKKPKMSTLEKSKLDWDSFKSEEGITEELAIHNRGKEGFLERKNFLERVDQRQFELEKNVRLSNMKR
ncbi:Craniofacial development protein 1 [Bagarius yarrelli]|uniref:Craniofacial development protein 1 n=1 Tax=Bagarius yarrelli TaxID=175774 RepID=A0A556V319_BAGYA|nr:Craniofacial development protein 1 [Bagarius yarrelli]